MRGAWFSVAACLLAAAPCHAATPILADIDFPGTTATVRVIALPPDAPRPAAGRDAFSHLPARTTAELLSAIRENTRLRRLYARHFGIPETRVMEFVRDALVLSALPEDRTVTTYGVTRAGRVYPVRQRLRKGTLVWTTRSGQLILKWLCSNPLRRSLPGTKVVGRPRSATPRPLSVPVRPQTLIVGDTPPVEAPLPQTQALIPMDALLPPPPSDSVEVPPPPLTGTGGARVAQTLPVRAVGGLALALPLVVLSDSHGIHTPGTPRILPRPSAIPEPSSLRLLMCAGIVVGLGVRTRRRARRGGG